jgi:hypothetical protein
MSHEQRWWGFTTSHRPNTFYCSLPSHCQRGLHPMQNRKGLSDTNEKHLTFLFGSKMQIFDKEWKVHKKKTAV